MKLAYQYIAIFYNFQTSSNHLHPLQIGNCEICHTLLGYWRGASVSFLTWVTHRTAYDSFLHVALQNRVDPSSHRLTVTHLWLLIAPMRNVSVCAETHVFCTTQGYSVHYASSCFLSCPIRGYSVFWNMVIILNIANLLSNNLSRSQVTFRHSNTSKNRLRLHNCQTRHQHFKFVAVFFVPSMSYLVAFS